MDELVIALEQKEREDFEMKHHLKTFQNHIASEKKKSKILRIGCFKNREIQKTHSRF